jgi:6-phosphogluconolactonase
MTHTSPTESNPAPHTWARIATLWAAVALGACGGGGNGGGTLDAPPPPASGPGGSVGSPPPPAPALQLAYGSAAPARSGRPWSLAPSALTGGSGTVASCGIRSGSANAAGFTGIGLSINATTCAISGTPLSTLAATAFTVRATDSLGQTADAVVSIEILASRPTFAYVAREGADAIGVYGLNATTGQLSATSQLTLAMGSAPRHTVYDAAHGRLYIANFGSNRIEMSTVNATTGTLSATTLATAMTEPVKLTIDPQGRFLYVVYGGGPGSIKGVSGFRINPTTGTLTQANFQGVSNPPTSLVVDPSGLYLYVGMESGGLQPYDIHPTTGALTQRTIHPIGISDLVVAPGVQRLYAGLSASRQSLVLNIEFDGDLTAAEFFEMTGFPPNAVAMDPFGKYLFSLDDFSKKINVMRIAASDGKLTEVSTVSLASSCTPESLAVAPDGYSVHVACSGSGPLIGHDLNRSTGTLSTHTSPTGVGARSITFAELP